MKNDVLDLNDPSSLHNLRLKAGYRTATEFCWNIYFVTNKATLTPDRIRDLEQDLQDISQDEQELIEDTLSKDYYIHLDWTIDLSTQLLSSFDQNNAILEVGVIIKNLARYKTRLFRNTEQLSAEDEKLQKAGLSNIVVACDSLIKYLQEHFDIDDHLVHRSLCDLLRLRYRTEMLLKKLYPSFRYRKPTYKVPLDILSPAFFS